MPTLQSNGSKKRKRSPNEEPSENPSKRASKPIASSSYLNKPLSFLDIGTEMVDLYVGSTEQQFRVHKRGLCRKIAYFDKMFNGGFKEASDNTAKLPEDNPAAFALLIQWVYTGIVPKTFLPDRSREHDIKEDKNKINEQNKDQHTQEGNEGEEVDEDGEREVEGVGIRDEDLENNSNEGTIISGTNFHDYLSISFYALAEKLCLDGIADTILDAVIEDDFKHEVLPSFEETRSAYMCTPAGSPLRRYVALGARCALSMCTEYMADPKVKAIFQAFLQEDNDFASDFIDLLLNSEIVDPHKLPRCDFHHHGIDEPCYLGYDRTSVFEISAADQIMLSGLAVDR